MGLGALRGDRGRSVLLQVPPPGVLPQRDTELLLFIKQSACFLIDISLGTLGIDSQWPRTYK